jgi:hypothetical protein
MDSRLVETGWSVEAWELMDEQSLAPPDAPPQGPLQDCGSGCHHHQGPEPDLVNHEPGVG